MTEDNKAQKMVEAIVDYIYEEGEGKITNLEVLGILEYVKQVFIRDLKYLEEE